MKMITQEEFDHHDCKTSRDGACHTCSDWYDQGETAKCKTPNCTSGELVDPKYTEDQIGSRCDKCLSKIGK